MKGQEELHADYTKRVVVDTGSATFVRSPARGVWRKRLELLGDSEQGRVTSVVRYDPGSRFPSHGHPAGEEILVLEGVFSDERGDFPAGSYQLNPSGFRHAPFSERGCLLFVKLRQYAGQGRELVLRNTRRGTWIDRRIPGVQSLPLYESRQHGENIRLTRFQPGARAPRIDLPDGQELFVISGALEDEHGTYSSGTWLRMPKGSHHCPGSPEGCVLYVKTGGFPC